MGRPKKPVIMCGICGDVRLISQASLIARACSKCRGKESAIVRTQAYRKRHSDKYKESNKKACKKWREKIMKKYLCYWKASMHVADAIALIDANNEDEAKMKAISQWGFNIHSSDVKAVDIEEYPYFSIP